MSDRFVLAPSQRRAAREGAPATATRVPRSATFWLIGGALVALLAGGCGYGRTRVVEIDASQFNSVVLRSNQPVLVNFYKDG